MRLLLLYRLVLVFCLPASVCVALVAVDPAHVGKPSFEQDVYPLLDRYCSKCHEGNDAKKEIDLLRLESEEEAFEHPELYQKAAWALWRDTMPPPLAEKQPTLEERELLLRWVDEVLTPRQGFQPSAPTLRRLNNREYKSAVRDLFQVAFEAEEFFPADNVSSGFDNIGSALAMSDMRFEKYVEAAEIVVGKAIALDSPEHLPVVHIGGDEMRGIRATDSLAHFYTNATATSEVYLPRDGVYRIRMQGWGRQAGNQNCLVRASFNGGDLTVWDVSSTRSEPGIYECEAILDGGEGVLAISFLNDYFRPKTDTSEKEDRNFYMDWIEVVGPIDAPEKTLFQKNLALRFPESLEGRRLEKTLEHLAFQVWRCPPAGEEVQRLLEIAGEQSPWEAAVRRGLEVMLVSPRFLFALEPNPPPKKDPGKVRDLSPFELATRMSLLLWGSVPDEKLLRSAAEGALSTDRGLERAMSRMIHSPRSKALSQGFAGQWLQVRNLKTAEVDRELFPLFTESMRHSMAEESLRLFEHVLREDRSVWELLDADYSFLNEELARLYEIQGVEGEHFRKVDISSSPRRGLLGHGSILTVTSRPTRTAPVIRGKWVLENIVGSPLPPPPPGADSLDEDNAANTEASLRKRLEAHRQKPNCISCHSVMDPIGFGLENFDPIGAWREEADAFPVDAAGTLLGGQQFEGALELVQILRQDDRFLRCVTEKLATYALGRPMNPQDRPMLQSVLNNLDPEHPTLRQILLGIIRSQTFRQRTVLRS
jgi:hypothetical protein